MLKPILTIAGSDCSGGAGIQADLKTITALGAYGMSAVTAITAQNTQTISEIMEIPAKTLKNQLTTIISDIYPSAVKVGMICSLEQVQVIADTLNNLDCPIVLDPVIKATNNSAVLSKQLAVRASSELLFHLADVITPNIPEAEFFVEQKINSIEDMEQAAEKLSKKYNTSILLKGGHLFECSTDVLYDKNGNIKHFESRWIRNKNSHGSGCTLSSAIAVFLAEGFSLDESIYRAKKYITYAFFEKLSLGHGIGPLCHNYYIDERLLNEKILKL